MIVLMVKYDMAEQYGTIAEVEDHQGTNEVFGPRSLAALSPRSFFEGRESAQWAQSAFCPSGCLYLSYVVPLPT